MAQKTPYTNYHDLNLDWIVKKIKSAINTAYNPDNPPPYPVTSVNGYAGAVQLDSKEIPYINGQPETVWDEVHKRYVKPASGIPAHDLADTYIESPAIAGNAGQVLTSDGHGSQSWQTPVSPDSIIDDNAGYGDTDKTWSADKLIQIEADIIDLQNDKLDAPYTAGAQGQVLTSDGNGGQTWEDIPPVVLDVSNNTPAPVMTIPDGADSLPMALMVGIEPVQAGSGEPSPVNVRPITGWNVTRIINNLLDYRKIFSDGEVLQSNILTYKMAIPNGTYTLSTNIPISGTLASCFFSNKDVQASSATNGVASHVSRTVTVTDGEVWIHVRTGNPSGGYIITEESIKNGTYWIYLEKGSTAKKKGIYEITFPDSAGTVYGGTLTINKDGSGTLVVENTILTITGDMVEGFGTGSGSANRVHTKMQYNDTYNTIIDCCNSYPVSTETVPTGSIGVRFHPTNGYIYIYNDDFTDITDAVTKISATPVVCVLELKNPDTYQLSELEVIETLKGINNIYADCGDILSVDYSADIKLYIDSKFNSIVPAEGEGF